MKGKFLTGFGKDKFGWYEFLFAMYLILAGYTVASLPMSALVLIILVVIALFRGGKFDFNPRIIGLLFAYVVIHDVIIWFILPSSPLYVISNIIVNIISVFAIYIISSVLDYHKMINMIYLVAIISLIGLYYHVYLINSGMAVQPIRLPFMPEMPVSSRAFEDGFRPKSFFWEPAACVTFLMVPFFISILQKRWLWVGILLFSMFISTSTTGIVLSVILLGSYFFIGKGKLGNRLLVVLMIAGILYLFLQTDVFKYGREKMYNTEVEENARISNGPLLIMSADPSDLIIGIPYANAFDYVKERNISSVGLQIDEESMFVPTFWSLLLNYGILGLILYFTIYWILVKQDNRLLPYIIALMVATFFQSISLGASFVFQMVVMLVIIKNKNKI